MIKCENCGREDELIIENDIAKCDVCKHYTKIVYMEYGGRTKMKEVKSEEGMSILDRLRQKENIPTTGGFFKFNTIKDCVAGTLMVAGELNKSTDPAYKDQWIYVLANAEGIQDGKPFKAEVVKVPLGINKKVSVEKANKGNVGDEIMFEYTSDYSTPEMIKARKQPFKTIEVYVSKK